jgi:hypothetical protein
MTETPPENPDTQEPDIQNPDGPTADPSGGDPVTEPDVEGSPDAPPTP